MDDLLSFIEKHWFGTILSVLLLLFTLRTVLKLFGWGRFNKRPVDVQSIGFYITGWISRLFNDFRHVLAFLIILFFFVAVIYALVWGGDSCEAKMDATKTVIASLGGLIGSIIGYYFGESKSRRNDNPEDGNNNAGTGSGPTPPPNNFEEVISEVVNSDTKKNEEKK